MSADPAYNYFREAFSEWIAAMEINGKAAQKEIADLLKINKSTAHRYVKGTRNIPFEKQVQIANGSGKNYLDFLIYGKQLFMQEPICKASLPENQAPPAQCQGKAKTEAQGDEELQTIVNRFLDMQEKHETRIQELEAKIEKLQEENVKLRLAQHRSPAKQGREQGRTPDKQTANGQ